jgi:hypothetical protein
MFTLALRFVIKASYGGTINVWVVTTCSIFVNTYRGCFRGRKDVAWIGL